MVSKTVTTLETSLLPHRRQPVKFGDYKSILVGTPEGTNLGPILWLIYCNDLWANGFSTVQYADDTTFYVLIETNSGC